MNYGEKNKYIMLSSKLAQMQQQQKKISWNRSIFNKSESEIHLWLHSECKTVNEDIFCLYNVRVSWKCERRDFTSLRWLS